MIYFYFGSTTLSRKGRDDKFILRIETAAAHPMDLLSFALQVTERLTLFLLARAKTTGDSSVRGGDSDDESGRHQASDRAHGDWVPREQLEEEGSKAKHLCWEEISEFRARESRAHR